MKSLGKFLAKYTALLWAVLKPLGLWGLFAIAIVDGSSIGLPIDLAVIGYANSDRSRLLLYVLVASIGEAIGSLVVYWIGYTSGGVLLRKRISPEKLKKIEQAFNRHEFWALMFPAMLPPPTPFKLFELAAAAFEMPLGKFLLAIFAGRFIRFFTISLLTLTYGPQFAHGIGDLFRKHFWWMLLAVAAGIAVWLLLRRRKVAVKDEAPELP